MRNNKNMVFGMLALLVAVSAITFAYAGYTGSLNVTGQGKVVSSKWDIHFNNLSSPTLTGTAKVLTAPTIQAGTTIGNYSVQLLAPGDSVSYTFDVVNEGNFNATLTTLTKNTPQCTTGFNCNNLTYTLVYTNGNTNVSNSDTLNAGETKTMKLTLTFNASNNSSVLATSDSTVSNLGITLLYSQVGQYTISSTPTVAPTPSGEGSSTLEVGDIVTWGTESFYVVNPDDGEGNVVLLAQYNLDWEDTGLQDESVVTLEFSDEPYWDPYGDGLISPYNANGASYDGNLFPRVYDSNSNLYNYVEDYVQLLKDDMNAPSSVTGRLLYQEEAVALGCSEDSYYCNEEDGGTAPEWVYSTSYWLGSAYYNAYLFVIMYDGAFYYSDFDDINDFGLRPVIIVSQADI